MQKLKEALTPLPMLIPAIPKKWKLKWEKASPEKHAISAIGESNSLQLKVKLETTDTLERKCVNSLVDSVMNSPPPLAMPSLFVLLHITCFLCFIYNYFLLLSFTPSFLLSLSMTHLPRSLYL